MKTLSVYERLYQQGLKMLNERDKLQGVEDMKQCTFKPDTRKIAKSKSPIRQVTPEKTKTKYTMKKNIGDVHVTGDDYKCYLQEAREAAQRRKREFHERFAEVMKKSEDRKVMTPKNIATEEQKQIKQTSTPRNAKNINKSVIQKKLQDVTGYFENKKTATPLSRSTAPFSPRVFDMNTMLSPRTGMKNGQTKKTFFNEVTNKSISPIPPISSRELPPQSLHLIDKAIQDCRKALGKSWQRPI